MGSLLPGITKDLLLLLIQGSWRNPPQTSPLKLGGSFPPKLGRNDVFGTPVGTTLLIDMQFPHATQRCMSSHAVLCL